MEGVRGDERKGCLDLESLGDSGGEVGEVQILILWRSELEARAAKEGLHLHSANLSSTATISQDETANIDNTLSIDEELNLSISLTNVIEANTLADGGPFASSKLERTASDGGAVGGVALRLRSDIANLLVGLKSRDVIRGKVGVELSGSISTPHKTS